MISKISVSFIVMHLLQGQGNEVLMGKLRKIHEGRLSFSENSIKSNVLTIIMMFVPM
jgi:hypothetical protein